MGHLELISECEGHLRDGRADLVARNVGGIALAKIPRSLRLPFANICRRANLIQQGLRILAPIVREDRRHRLRDATPDELAEYAFLIMKNGSIGEAQRLLQTIEPKECANATLYAGFCHMMRWEYREALPYFETFLSLKPELYQATIAKVNFAASLITLAEFPRALELLAEIEKDSRSKGFSRLLANAQELRAQIHLAKKDYSRCEADLEEAKRILSTETTSDQLFVSKWHALLTAARSSSIEPIESFRRQAEERGHWESLRDCDYHSLKIRFDDKLFSHLYYGTPYPAYRARLANELGYCPPEANFLHGDAGADLIFDLKFGTVRSGDAASGEKIEMKIHQVFQVLFQDFYRPAQIGTLFGELFPDEYYDPFSSRNRVHQNLWRARAWAKDRLPLQIEEVRGRYRAVMTGPMAVILPAQAELADKKRILWESLKVSFSGWERFKSSEAMSALGLSHTSFRRLAKWALETGRLERTGKSAETWYRIAS